MALCADAKAGREVGTIKDYSLTSTDADSADLKLLETANLDDIQAAWATAPTYKDIVD